VYALGHPEWHVPEFRALELASRRARWCVCVPVIDEGPRIRRQLERMRPFVDELDVAIADGGSRDGSLAESFLRTTGVRALLTKTGPGRLSAQMRMAMAWGMEQGYEGLIFVDGNDKDGPDALPRFAAKLAEGWDHVQGSRYVPGGKGVNTPLSRQIGVMLLHAPLVSLAARHRYTDTTNGFRAYSRRLLLDPRVQPFRDVFAAYELHYYLAIRAARLGFRVCEIPVTRVYPPEGPTPSKISPLRGNLLVLGTLLRAVRGAYDPKAR
jgi:hypothetical protein